MANPPKKVLQLKITLKDIKPPIWRRVLVSEEITLSDLHQIIQAVFGWQDYHLHEFKIHSVRYREPEESEFDDFGTEDEYLYRLKDFRFRKGSQFTYLYDFGDDWGHTVLIEEMHPFDKKIRLPQFIDGKRAAPPEDVGGVYGYQNFLEAINDPNHEEHEEFLVWIGGKFDSEFFDKELVTYRCELIAQALNDWNIRRNLWLEDPEDWIEPQIAREQWIKTIQKEDLETIRDLPLLKDTITLLTYLQNNKITGTLSTGNLSQKAVREFSALMTNPPSLIIKIGNYIQELKNEADVWPVYFVHLMLYWADLVEGSKGKVWKLTAKGESYLKSSPAEQLHILFCGWWFHGEWHKTRFPYSKIQHLPAQLPKVVLYLLTTTIDSKPVSRDDFCNLMKSVLAESNNFSQDDFELERVRIEIEEIVLQPLLALGLLKGNFVEKISYGDVFKDLISFQLRNFGREVLKTMIDKSFYREIKANLN